MKIVADAHIPHVNHYFAQYGELVLKPGREITASDVVDADILLVRSITPVNQALLENTSVKYVGSMTAGADHLDTAWLDKAGIAWDVAQGFNAPPVADYVISVIAALQKRELLGQKPLRAAVIGAGHVGKLVIERLQRLDIDIIVCDPLRAQTESNFKSVALADIADVDLICLHVPLTQEGPHATYRMIDQAFLRRQKPGCVLLNASRGAVINESDLKQYGKHLFWCLDVWENEPNIDKEILARCLVATPHIAGYSVQSKIRGIEMIYRKAVERGFLTLSDASALAMPTQQLTLAKQEGLDWRDTVLGVFNPILLSTMMRTLLLPAESGAQQFDSLRNQINYRHELSYSKVGGV